MKLLLTHSFIRDYQALPGRLQKVVDGKLALLIRNPRHPSLRLKKMQDPRNIWEGRITRGYRFTFQMQADAYVLRRLGTHDILKTLKSSY
jgi:mRNA-degrading endonuclease RelE of RelBE toxin-antitoxin system